MRIPRSIVVIAALLVAGAVWMAVGTGRADATTGSTAHSVSKASETNYSGAVEDPSWTFSCTAATGAWHFAITGVQVIDASGHPWNRSSGPWHLTFFAADAAGPVPFSELATLQQNKTNGLFEATKSGTSTNARTWCVKGAAVSVVGFSNDAEPLLLDGTLS